MLVPESRDKSASAAAEVVTLRAVLGDVDRKMCRVVRVWDLRQAIHSMWRAVLQGLLTSAAALGGYTTHQQPRSTKGSTEPAMGPNTQLMATLKAATLNDNPDVLELVLVKKIYNESNLDAMREAVGHKPAKRKTA